MLRGDKKNKHSPFDYNLLQCNRLLRWLLAIVATLHLNMANLGIDNKKSDVNGFGVLLLELPTKQRPFDRYGAFPIFFILFFN